MHLLYELAKVVHVSDNFISMLKIFAPLMNTILAKLESVDEEGSTSTVKHLKDIVNSECTHGLPLQACIQTNGCVDQLVDALYYLIWSTPVFKKQVALVDAILNDCGESVHRQLVSLVIERFPEIRTDRRDKFYYLISKSFHLITFTEMLAFADTGLLEYSCTYINNCKPADWDDILFLEFFVSCPAWLCDIFSSVRIAEPIVRPYFERNMPAANRKALYKLFQ